MQTPEDRELMVKYWTHILENEMNLDLTTVNLLIVDHAANDKDYKAELAEYFFEDVKVSSSSSTMADWMELSTDFLPSVHEHFNTLSVQHWKDQRTGSWIWTWHNGLRTGVWGIKIMWWMQKL